MTTHSAQLQKIQELIITLFDDPFSLTALSDADYQKKVWLEVDQWERPVLGASARVRDCCRQILQIPLAHEYIGERNFTLLKELYAALDAYDFKICNYQRSYIRCSGEDGCCNRLKKEEIQEVLDDSQWHAIQSMAKDLYDNLSRLELMGMRIDSQHECLKEILDNVVGQKVASIELGHGSFLTIDLGMLVSKATKQKNREFRTVGEWHFWIYMCAWRIDKDNKPLVASSDPREKIAAKIQEIAGTTLTKYEILNDSLDAKFDFDESITLTLFNTSTDDEDQWMLFTPDKKVLVIGPADTWTYRLSSSDC